MATVTLGKTYITVNKNGFGALPIQRVPMKEAVYLLHKAHDGGISFYDTARFYTDSEDKLGEAFSDRRHRVFLASKTMAATPREFREQLDTTLLMLKTNYLDLYQFHNPAFCPRPGDGSGLYEEMQLAIKKGKVRFSGVSNHRMAVAQEVVECGLYDTLQFPFSYLATEQDIALVKACDAAGMGFLAMKAMGGGLITNSAAAYAWMSQFEHALPIWGIQRESELDEFLSYNDSPPALDDHMATIEADRRQLGGSFCRGCGYCMPCPAGIQINDCARMSLMLRRHLTDFWLTPQNQEMMKKIEGCTHCGQCAKKCPYGLDTPALLQENYADYMGVLAGAPA